MTMLPLLGPYHPEDPIAWLDGQPISCAKFLTHLAQCKKKLPDKRHVLNLCTDRYWFLVGFAAALLRGQVTLLPPSRAPQVLEQIGSAYLPCYTLTDGRERVEGLESVSIKRLLREEEPPLTNPHFPGHHPAVIAFTSGSTGTPRPNAKTWESLVMIAQKTGTRMLGGEKEKRHIVATVPHQHMYGLETSIMLPIQYGWSFHSGRPFYPEDIRSALLQMPENRMLVSTPIHLRACLTERTKLPDLQCVLSATAPLSGTVAQSVETLWNTQLLEIYGFAEAGTIATRRTATGECWKLLDGLFLGTKGRDHSVNTPYFPVPISIPDSINLRGPHQFDLQGRPGNLINIGGHRASLDDLNFHLTNIDGVIDGVFFMPETQEKTVPRLIAFAVAPGIPCETILASLKKKIDPVFLPRPIYLVESLPRNATGKLPQSALAALAEEQSDLEKLSKKSSTQ